MLRCTASSIPSPLSLAIGPLVPCPMSLVCCPLSKGPCSMSVGSVSLEPSPFPLSLSLVLATCPLPLVPRPFPGPLSIVPSLLSLVPCHLSSGSCLQSLVPSRLCSWFLYHLSLVLDLFHRLSRTFASAQRDIFPDYVITRTIIPGPVPPLIFYNPSPVPAAAVYIGAYVSPEERDAARPDDNQV